MHAEQVIESYLARAINRITAGNVGERNAGNKMIIPMAGRLVPCGICSEVEAQAKIRGGLFSTEGLTLYRASERIGDIFSGKQLVAETALNVECPKLAKEKAIEIKDMVETTKDHHSLQALKVPLALKYFPKKDSPSHSFDTDSTG